MGQGISQEMWPPEHTQGILPYIEGPKDLKRVPLDRLDELASEIRQRITDVTRQTGGHYGANFGVVELTIALHRVFDFPNDSLVWDVGHQCYPHKLLTGRNEQFETLRQQGGLMGFPNPQESPYDPFCTGHAGTSISTAWGIQLANEMQGLSHRGIAVIGDASLSSGMAFEALNDIGHVKKNMLVILNDNQMSIAPSVGALHGYLNKFRIDKHYREVKEDLKSVLDKIPLGSSVRKSISYVQDFVRHMFAPGWLFEELGFRYYGPIDGHNIQTLIRNLEQVQNMQGPVLLHVRTIKGKGCEQAESDQRKFHAVKPEKKTELVQAEKSYTQIFSEEMVAIADEDPALVAITAAMPDGTGLHAFADVHPERMFDVGICEQHAVGLAAGLAKAGLKPVAAIYSTFLQRAFDQLHQEACLQNLPVKFALDRGGVVGDDGPTHHGVFDLSYLRILPNMTVCAPKDEAEFRSMLRFVVDYQEGPIAIRYPRGTAPAGLPAPAVIERGKGEIICKGKDVAILAIGATVHEAMRAAAALAEKDIYATVFNARFVKPLDRDAIVELADSHGAIITVEDNALAGGFGSAVLELLQDAGRQALVRRLGFADAYVEHAPIPYLYRVAGIDAAGMVRCAEELCREKTGYCR